MREVIFKDASLTIEKLDNHDSFFLAFDEDDTYDDVDANNVISILEHYEHPLYTYVIKPYIETVLEEGHSALKALIIHGNQMNGKWTKG